MIAAIFHVHWGYYAPSLLKAGLKTLEFTGASYVGAIILGFVLALLRISPTRMARIPAAIYTEIFKNVPLLTWVFIIYYGLSSVGITLSTFVAGSLSLILFYAAYLGEIFRAGLQGVPRGQTEAAQAIGLGRTTTVIHVVMPQALRLSLAGTATMLVDLLKSTSLLVTIAGAELMTQGQIITSVTFRALEVYVVIGAIYFALCYPTSQAVLWLERRLQRGDAISLRRRRILKTVLKLSGDPRTSAEA